MITDSSYGQCRKDILFSSAILCLLFPTMKNVESDDLYVLWFVEHTALIIMLMYVPVYGFLISNGARVMAGFPALTTLLSVLICGAIFTGYQYKGEQYPYFDLFSFPIIVIVLSLLITTSRLISSYIYGTFVGVFIPIVLLTTMYTLSVDCNSNVHCLTMNSHGFWFALMYYTCYMHDMNATLRFGRN